MNAKLEHFVSELSQLEPANDDPSLEHKLYELARGIEDVDDPSSAYSHIFRFFERFPNAEHGSPGALVHLIERSVPAYFDELVLSVERRPTPHTLWMLNRILNSDIPSVRRAEFMALLDASTRHPLADAIAREQATGFLQHRRKRSR